MCDNPNTTHIVETDCWQCPTLELCNLWEDSYFNRCRWLPIKGRISDDFQEDGVCNDGRDYVELGGSGIVASLGWLLMMFAVGWVRKDRGKFAALRRHGHRVTAFVVSRSVEPTQIPTADGLPDVVEERAYLTVSWRPRVAVQSGLLGCLVYPRCGPCKWHLRRCCRGGACAGCCGGTSSKATGGLRPQHGGAWGPGRAWERFRDATGSGTIEYKMHVPRSLYSRADLTMRLVYDPWDDRNWVLPEAAVGQPVPVGRFVLCVVRHCLSAVLLLGFCLR
eukprot:SAG22_NODE_3948_length_1454_cov_1.888561_1_plen_277_part_01